MLPEARRGELAVVVYVVTVKGFQSQSEEREKEDVASATWDPLCRVHSESCFSFSRNASHSYPAAAASSRRLRPSLHRRGNGGHRAHPLLPAIHRRTPLTGDPYRRLYPLPLLLHGSPAFPRGPETRLARPLCPLAGALRFLGSCPEGKKRERKVAFFRLIC
jgi:hypothetical protein